MKEHVEEIQQLVASRGRSTFAMLEEQIGGATFRGFGFSVADGHDEPDQAIGDALALGRAHADLGSRLKRAAWDEVNQRDRERREALERELAEGYTAHMLEEAAERLAGDMHVVVHVDADTSAFEEKIGTAMARVKGREPGFLRRLFNIGV